MFDFIVFNGVVYFVNHSDQNLYKLQSPMQEPTQLTNANDMRYADCTFHLRGNKLICIREDHTVVKSGAAKEAQNVIVMVDLATLSQTILVRFISCFLVLEVGS